MRQARSSNDIAVTVTESVSIYPSYSVPTSASAPTTSSSTFSSVTLSGQGGRLPSDILPSVNLGLLSVDSPALLTTPSVLPFQSTGSASDVVPVRTRPLIMVDGCRGRGFARVVEVLSEDDGPFTGKCRTSYGQAEAYAWDNGRAMASESSAPAHNCLSMAVPALTANTITSTVTVRESAGTPSPLPLQFTALRGRFMRRDLQEQRGHQYRLRH